MAIFWWLLGCWASNRSAGSGCFALEQQLRTCMDNGVCSLVIRFSIALRANPNSFIFLYCILFDLLSGKDNSWLIQQHLMDCRNHNGKARARSITTSCECFPRYRDRERRTACFTELLLTHLIFGSAPFSLELLVILCQHISSFVLYLGPLERTR